MADYIRLNILCQAYVHLDLPHSARRDADFKEHLANYVKSRARFFFYDQVETEIESSEGSFRGKITVYGTLTALVAAIHAYGGFREGIHFLYEDSARLAEMLVGESLFVTRARHKTTLRVEARKGVIGSLRRIVDEIDALKTHSLELSPKEMAARLDRLHEDATKLFENIQSDEDREFIARELAEMIKGLPQRPPRRRKDRTDDVYIAAYESRRKDVVDMLKDESGPRSKKS